MKIFVMVVFRFIKLVKYGKEENEIIILMIYIVK